eukprot:s2930_g5.t1
MYTVCVEDLVDARIKNLKQCKGKRCEEYGARMMQRDAQVQRFDEGEAATRRRWFRCATGPARCVEVYIFQRPMQDTIGLLVSTEWMLEAEW